MGRWSSRCHPGSRSHCRRRRRHEAPRRQSHPHPRCGDAVGMDNGALTAGAYWPRCSVIVDIIDIVGARGVRAGTPGSIRSLLVRRRASTSPRLSVPRVATYLLPFNVIHFCTPVRSRLRRGRNAVNGRTLPPPCGRHALARTRRSRGQTRTGGRSGRRRSRSKSCSNSSTVRSTSPSRFTTT